MSSYKQYKNHIYDKLKNGPYCKSKPMFPEYAKNINEINCEFCIKLVEQIKEDIAKDYINNKKSTFFLV